MKLCASEILLKTLPTLVYRKLLHFTIKAGLWSNSTITSPKKLVRVYDIKNVGRLNRFTVVGHTPFIVHNCGHDLFLYLLTLTAKRLTEAGIHWKPYIVDVHDAFMITVPEEQAQQAKVLIDNDILKEFNDYINGPVKLSGETNIVNNWWEDKKE